MTEAVLPTHLAPAPPRGEGVWIGLGIIALWASTLVYALALPKDWASPWTYVLVLALTHLYTGMFITAHDAMHGLVSSAKRLNQAIGTLAALLFAYNWYPTLLANHRKHHAYAAQSQDPDWHPGGFWIWYLSFAKHYITWWQIAAMALTYNLAKLWLPAENLILFWMVPAVASTFQLFYFGTYLPHKGDHAVTDPHRARSQGLGHVWAFASCYFFGYHHEHHAMPWLPWYKLPSARAFTAKAEA